MHPNITHYWSPRDQEYEILREYIHALRDGCEEKASRIMGAVFIDGSDKLRRALTQVHMQYQIKGTLPNE